MTTAILPQNESALQNLIPAIIGEMNGEQQPLVNARQLHQFLESKQDFSNWINTRIQQYGFTQDIDYLLNKIIVQLPSGAKHAKEYHLTLDMAKELSMVERNDKGRMARRYFINCERQLYTQPAENTDPLNQIADHMATLAQGMNTVLKQMNQTDSYIKLLEVNQKRKIKVTQEVALEVKRYRALGYSLQDIADLLRLGKTTVSLIVNDKYNFADLPNDKSNQSMIETAKTIMEQSSQQTYLNLEQGE